MEKTEERCEVCQDIVMNAIVCRNCYHKVLIEKAKELAIQFRDIFIPTNTNINNVITNSRPETNSNSDNSQKEKSGSERRGRSTTRSNVGRRGRSRSKSVERSLAILNDTTNYPGCTFKMGGMTCDGICVIEGSKFCKKHMRRNDIKNICVELSCNREKFDDAPYGYCSDHFTYYNEKHGVQNCVVDDCEVKFLKVGQFHSRCPKHESKIECRDCGNLTFQFPRYFKHGKEGVDLCTSCYYKKK